MQPQSLFLLSGKTTTSSERRTRALSLLLALWCYLCRAASLGRRYAPASVGALLCLLAFTLPASAATSWRTPWFNTRPEGRVFAGMAYDSARRVCVMYGGYENNTPQSFDDTWEYDGSGWTQKTPASRPSARTATMMAYDSARSVTVLFGGRTVFGNTNETWEWNATNWTLRNPATAPPAFNEGTLAYDSARRVCVLFGGNETWEWNGTNWTKRAPTTSPSSRTGASLTYDSTRRVCVLYGGYDGTTELSDTWEYNGTTWTRRTPSTFPPKRRYASIAYDSARGVTVLFGGITGILPLYDTWEWNGTNWTEITPANSISRRWGTPLVFDSGRSMCVGFGGQTFISGFVSETAEYGVLQAPIISGFTPTAGKVGTQVRITGTGFSGFSNVYTVTFNGTETYTYSIDSATQITATVPSGATTGRISVTSPGGTSTSSANFRINRNPTASNDSPTIPEDSAATVVNVLGNDSSAPDTGETLSVTAVTQPANGVVTLTAGVVRYRPNANYNGTDSFTYTISDGIDGTATATVSVGVTPVNDNPTANDDSMTIPEDSPLRNIDPRTNDSIAPDTGETLSVTAVTQPSHGTSTFSSNSVRYRPNANYNGTDTFSYTVNDGNGGTATARVNVTITPVNDPPTVTNDSVTVAEDSGATVVNVLANDSNAPDTGETLTVTAVTQPTNGTVTLTGGVVRYAPKANYFGTDSFTYTISDGNTSQGNDTATGTVSVTVTPVNDDPTANDDTVTIAENSAGNTVNVLANDTIAPDTGETLTVTTVTQPANGTVTLTGGVVRYTPTANFNGTDSFTYTISDGKGGTDTATVTVTVSSVNSDPTAENDATTVAEDSSGTVVDVLGNDSSAPDPAETLTVTAVTQPANGSVTLVAGVVTFTPAPNFFGGTSFTYTISDGNGGTATATVSVTVTPANDDPTATNDAVTVDEDSDATVVDVLANDSSAPDAGETLTVTAVTQPANGTVTLTGGVARFTPATNFHGTDSFTYTLSDGNGGTATATVNVTVNSVNDDPTANNDAVTVQENSAATVVSVLGNDSFAPDTGETLTVIAVTQPAHGVVTLAAGVISYKPNTSFNGTDSFTYTISDGNGGTDTATVTVTVEPINHDPIATNDEETVDEDSAATVVNVLGNDSIAPDTGETLTVTAVTQPANGVVSLQEGIVRYAPTANFNGTDSFSYTISDGNGGTATATVTITVTSVNDAPTATNDAATVGEDSGSTVIDVRGNDSFAPDRGETLTVTAVSQSANGAVTLADGVVSYVPNPNFNGTDSFTYTISDGNGGTATATVTITVTAVNDAPVANNDSYNTAFGTTLTVSAPGVLGNDSDVENNTVTIVDGNSVTPAIDPVTGTTSGTLVLNADGSFVYTPNSNFTGEDTFTYKISDGQLANSESNIATVTIRVAANTHPVAVNDSANTNEDTFVDIDVVKNDTDAEGSALSVVADSIAELKGGTAELQADGKTIRFTPNANANDGNTSDGFSFTYKVSDGTSASLTAATVTVTVSAVNDAPVVGSVSLKPGAPKTGETVTADVVASDVDGDTPTYKYIWKNGTTTLSETGNTLDLSVAGNGDKGDQITVTVTANDGTVDSAAFTSDPVTVANTAPVVDNVYITPTRPLDSDVLTAMFTASDVDNDTLTYSYVWKKLGVIIPDQTGPTLPASETSDGDSITVTVTANDGTNNSEGMSSFPIRVGNLAPVIFMVTPQSASDKVGNKRTFTTTVNDGNGARDIKEVWLIVNTARGWNSGATLVYRPGASDPTKGTLTLRRGDTFLPAVQVGTDAVLDNGAMRILASEVTVGLSSDRTTLILTIPATIRDGLVGNNILFAYVTDAAGATDPAAQAGDQGFVAFGPYTVTSQFSTDTNSAPTLGKLSPGATYTTLNAAGIAPNAQTIGFFGTDADGAGDLDTLIFVAGKSISFTGNSTFMYQAKSRRLYLRSDDGQSWLGGVQVGQPTTTGILENSQVKVDLSKVIIRVLPDGKSVGLSLPLQAKTGLIGANKIWLRVQDTKGAKAPDGDAQGYVLKGTWTVARGNSGTTTPPSNGGS